MSETYRATLEHLERMVAKRDSLDVKIGEAFDAFLVQLERAGADHAEAAALYCHVQSLRFVGTPEPHAPIDRACTAMGYRRQDVLAWVKDSRNMPGVIGTSRGDFPLEDQWFPIKGKPCVYAIYADEVLVYIGRSINVRTRLRDHWNDPGKPGLTGWSFTMCKDRAQMVDLERYAIERYSPRYNAVGSRFRTVS